MISRSFLSLALGFLVVCAGARPASAVETAWPTDYPAALKQATAADRPILADFTGSDWCPWCIRLVKETFSQPAFAAYAKDNLELLEVDFPRGKEQSPEIKKQNDELKKKFAIEGFPTLILINKDGKEIARQVGYLKGGPEAMIAWIKEAQAKKP